MKKIGIMLLMIFLNSCGFPQIKPPLERCVVSFEYQKCRCHLYEISKNNIGRISDSIDHPIEYCENLIGFRPDEWSRLAVWFHQVFAWLHQQSDSKWVKKKLKKINNNQF